VFPFFAEPQGFALSALLATPAAKAQLVGAWDIWGLFVLNALFNTVLGEELFFRGLLLPRMAGVFGKGDWVMNGLLFGLYHLHQPWGILSSAIDGIFLLGDVFSLTVGAGETCFSRAELQVGHQAFATARANHATVYAVSGDSGSAVEECDSTGTPIALIKGVFYPASDPLVTSAGGTSLLATQSGKYMSETTWNESANDNDATGGGFSSLFARPIAGTSAGAPQWAAITALADQAAGERLGFLNPTYYHILKSASYAKGFHDITTGNNAFTFQSNGQTVTIPGYDAGPGWDPTTGVGTPKVTGLVPLL
jgi:hypothetical protein